MLARKKSSCFIYNKFTSNLKILALLLMMRKITLEVKFDEKYVHSLKISSLIMCQCGALVESQAGDSWFPPSLCF
jgi:hypothetical protein